MSRAYALLSLAVVACALFAAAFSRSDTFAQAAVNGVPANQYSRDEVNTLARQQLDEMQATIPRQVKGFNVLADGNGAFTITLPADMAFVSPVPLYTAETVFAGVPTKCQITARSAIAVSGICYLSTKTTLGGTLAGIAGTVIDPFGGRVPAGTPIMVIGREPTPIP